MEMQYANGNSMFNLVCLMAMQIGNGNSIDKWQMAIKCLIMKIKMQLSNENVICKWKFNVQ